MVAVQATEPVEQLVPPPWAGWLKLKEPLSDCGPSKVPVMVNSVVMESEKVPEVMGAPAHPAGPMEVVSWQVRPFES